MRPRLNSYTLWNVVVTTYTPGSLTYGSEKLTAISALERYTQNLMGGGVTYLAGLWSPYLASQLLGKRPDILF